MKHLEVEINQVAKEFLRLNDNYRIKSDTPEMSKFKESEFRSGQTKTIEACIKNIITRLENVRLNPIAKVIWLEVGRTRDLFKPKVGEEELNVNENISEVIYYLKIANNKPFTNVQVIQALVARTNLRSKRNEVLNTTNYEAAFIILGALLWIEKVNEKKVSLIGAPLIHDIITCVPTISEIQSILKNILGEYIEDISVLNSLSEKPESNFLISNAVKNINENIKLLNPNYSEVTLN